MRSSTKLFGPHQDSRLGAIFRSRRGRRGGARRIAIMGIVVILALAVGAAALARWRLERWSAVAFGGGEPVALTIEPGASLGALAEELQSAGVIDDARRFRFYAYLKGKQNVLQAGNFRFAVPISPAEALSQLQHGTFQKKITIPEGWTAGQVGGALLAGEWIESAEEWEAVVAEPVNEKYFGEAIEEGAKGFCFPDTYFFETDATAAQIRARMLDQFARVWSELAPERRDDRSALLSVREVVTLASMIQREARGIEELPMIASVYLNRLKIRMKLQCCATVHYALGEVWDRGLTYKDLKIESPYNTYRIRGLPPGPIGSPGREALEAVLRPAQTDHLFYVYRGDGTHEFTKTYKEHMKAARRFRESDPTAEFVEDESSP